MDIMILETDAKSFFAEAQNLENSCPEGKWRYCKFLDVNSVYGIFENENSFSQSFKAHPDFFKYFLGLFTPSTKTSFDLHHEKNFKSFCKTLNNILIQEKSIYDLSVHKKWIWSEGSDISVPKQLSNFLDFK